MRGGAWPLTIFASLMVLMGIANRIWVDSTIQSATFGFAACISYLAVAALLARGRGEPVRRGAPESDGDLQAIPSASLGAVAMGLGVAALTVGFVFGEFLVILGIGQFVVGGWLVVREMRTQRRQLRSLPRERLP
jgi:hypothetical protein